MPKRAKDPGDEAGRLDPIGPRRDHPPDRVRREVRHVAERDHDRVLQMLRDRRTMLQQQREDAERLLLQPYPCRSRPQLPCPFVELECAEPEGAFRS